MLVGMMCPKGSKKLVRRNVCPAKTIIWWSSRFIKSVLASTGVASSTRIDVMNRLHVDRGMRNMVMPGAAKLDDRGEIIHRAHQAGEAQPEQAEEPAGLAVIRNMLDAACDQDGKDGG